MQSPNQFIPLQQSLASDALNEYIHHTGSAVFAVPPGLRPGQHYGDALLPEARAGQGNTRPGPFGCIVVRTE